MLVDLALARAPSLLELVIADVGTGSGAIAIALAHALPDAEIVATDISAEALEIASRNLTSYGLQKRVRLVQGDLVEPLSSSPSLIIANLPYLPISDQDLVHPDVLSEPYRSLFAEENGTALYRRLLEQLNARSWSPMMLLEMDPRQVGQMQQIVRRFYPPKSIRILEDLAGRDRYMCVEPPA
jgi:release factor glutamine methyltransferase